MIESAEQKKSDLELKLKNAENYNKYITSLYDEIKGFKHDFYNIINCISGYIQADDMKGLKDYFSSIEKDILKTKNLELLNPTIINNPALYNLICTKYQKATSLGISFNLDIFSNFDNLNIPIYKLSRILGILLDNSIEAAKDSSEKIINIIFREYHKQRFQIISIENTYSNKNIDISKIFKKGCSSKQNHSGIGLWEVKKIISENENLTLNTTKDKIFFKQELEIY